MSRRGTHQAAAASHNPATTEAGATILAAGGSAADAAIAMTLAACVSEPLVVSLLSGMHAIHVGPEGHVHGVDGFVDIPAARGDGRTVQTEVVFDDEAVPYTIGPATFGAPALVDGCRVLHARFGRLPWRDLLAPALRLADRGVVLDERDGALLRMLRAVMTMNEGAAVFLRPDGGLLEEGDRVRIPGLGGTLERLAADAEALNRGPLADELAALVRNRGGSATAEDLDRARAVVHAPPSVALGARAKARTRRGLSPVTDILDRLAQQPAGLDQAATAVVRAQAPNTAKARGTTSLAATDTWGGACAVTASLGLGTGDWFHGAQLNSMLGERDLIRGEPRAGVRMGSMMAPTALLDDRGLVAVLGSAGGSRIPSAITRVTRGLLDGLGPVEAVELPRLHRDGDTVHVEPHLADADLAAIEALGLQVRRWATRHHFFGGVSIAGRGGAEGDPRRGGTALRV